MVRFLSAQVLKEKLKELTNYLQTSEKNVITLPDIQVFWTNSIKIVEI